MQNLKQTTKNKIGHIYINNIFLQYAVINPILVVTYNLTKDNTGVVSYNLQKIKDISSDHSILSSIETTNIPIYLLSKNKIRDFILFNYEDIPENIKEEILSILEDFNNLSYKDFIDAVYGDIEYDILVSDYIKKALIDMRKKNLKPYYPNKIITESFELIRDIIK